MRARRPLPRTAGGHRRAGLKVVGRSVYCILFPQLSRFVYLARTLLRTATNITTYIITIACRYVASLRAGLTLVIY